MMVLSFVQVEVNCSWWLLARTLLKKAC